MPELSDWEKKEWLAKISYRDFLLDFAKVHPDVIPFYDDGPKGLFCVGIDAYPALYAWAEGSPGFQGMGLEPFSRVGPLTPSAEDSTVERPSGEEDPPSICRTETLR